MSHSINNRHFLLRRLHSLFGVAPLGFFLMFHLWENSQSRFGAEHYNEKVVGFLQGMNYLPFIEIGL
ncbi:succinate dehydrogenase, partial [Candidatus Endoriftia persephone str. Guaymas]|nr:succinate dehydrogenase [Candidatus Endoriftia persephone str. Guaymas]